MRVLIYHDWLSFTLQITVICSVAPTMAISGDVLCVFRAKMWKPQSFAISKSAKPFLLLKQRSEMFCFVFKSQFLM